MRYVLQEPIQSKHLNTNKFLQTKKSKMTFAPKKKHVFLLQFSTKVARLIPNRDSHDSLWQA